MRDFYKRILGFYKEYGQERLLSVYEKIRTHKERERRKYAKR